MMSLGKLEQMGYLIVVYELQKNKSKPDLHKWWLNNKTTFYFITKLENNKRVYILEFRNENHEPLCVAFDSELTLHQIQTSNIVQ